MDEKERDLNGDLAREMFLCWAGKYRNLTFEEKKKVDLFLEKNKINYPLIFGRGKMRIDPVLLIRGQRLVEKYGDIVIDILHDLLYGFPEDGIVDEIDEEEKNLLAAILSGKVVF